MKKLLFALLFFLISCTNDIFVESKQDNIDLQRYNLMDTVTILADPNYFTIATINNDTIYKGNVSVNISKPWGEEINYSKAPITRDIEDILFVYENEGIVVFEDVIDGDNDYNDFVAEVELEVFRLGSLLITNIDVQPLALGNSIPLGFGVELYIQDRLHFGTHLVDKHFDIPIYDDIRRDAFYNANGFINTVGPRTYNIVNYNKSNRYVDIFMNFNTIYITVMYYIDIKTNMGTRRQYTVNTIKNNFKKDGRPYGLFIPDDDFKYPKEGVSIFDAYPNFERWANTRRGKPFKNPNENLLYEY